MNCLPRHPETKVGCEPEHCGEAAWGSRDCNLSGKVGGWLGEEVGGCAWGAAGILLTPPERKSGSGPHLALWIGLRDDK